MVGCLAGPDINEETEPRAAPHADEPCRVELVDSFNEFTTIIEAVSSKHESARSFTITDEGLDTMIEAHFDRRSAPLETDVSVPDDTLNQIREDYQSSGTIFFTQGVVEVDEQLTYTLLSESRCTRDEFALIEFFVNEWLYFG